MYSALSVSRNMEKHWPDFHETWWKGVAWAKEEPITFWSGYTNYFSLSLTLRERTWLLWRSTQSECPSSLLRFYFNVSKYHSFVSWGAEQL